MTTEEKEALRTVVDYLDRQMAETPSRELADASNYLEALYQKGEL